MVKRIIFLMTMVSLFHWGKAQSDEQGFQYINYERYESAANEFQQLIKMKPVDAKAWYGLSQAMIYQQKTDEAYNLLQSANADVKDNPWYNVALGAVLLEKSNGQEAAGYFENALKATKEKDADILSAIAQAHIHAKSGNNAYAIELLNKAIKRNKKNAELYVQLGNAYRNLQNTTEGYKAYQTAININDKYAPAYHQLGFFLFFCNYFFRFSYRLLIIFIHVIQISHVIFSLYIRIRLYPVIIKILHSFCRVAVKLIHI